MDDEIKAFLAKAAAAKKAEEDRAAQLATEEQKIKDSWLKYNATITEAISIAEKEIKAINGKIGDQEARFYLGLGDPGRRENRVKHTSISVNLGVPNTFDQPKSMVIYLVGPGEITIGMNATRVSDQQMLIPDFWVQAIKALMKRYWEDPPA